MNVGARHLSWLLVWAASSWSVGAAAQDAAGPTASPPAAPAAGGSSKPSPKSTAQIDAGEPRATTSPASPGGAGAPAPAADSTGAVPATPAPAGPNRASAAKAGPSPSVAPTPAGRPRAAGDKGPAAADRVALGTATVTGDREQPKVMYIVPWKKSDIGDLTGKPMNSLLDEALAPVDRDEFRREVTYYGAVKADTSQNGASRAATQGEK